jgi:hypothetical protein
MPWQSSQPSAFWSWQPSHPGSGTCRSAKAPCVVACERMAIAGSFVWHAEHWAEA